MNRVRIPLSTIETQYIVEAIAGAHRNAQCVGSRKFIRFFVSLQQ